MGFLNRGLLNYNDVKSTIPTYKVYSALLTQSGGNNYEGLNSGELTIGVSYVILEDGGVSGWDFTNVGAPNNDFDTYFVATGTTPANWGSGVYLEYNTGAPVVTVLENTIGNIWWTYDDIGNYSANSNNLFVDEETYFSISDTLNVDDGSIRFRKSNSSQMSLYTRDNSISQVNGYLNNTPLEIRVYNETITTPVSDGRYYIRLLDGDNNNTIMFTGFFYVDPDTHIVQSFYDLTNPTVDIKSSGNNGGPTYLYNPGWFCFDGGGCNITSFPYLYGSSQGDYNLYGNPASSTGNNVDGYNNVTYLFSLTPF